MTIEDKKVLMEKAIESLAPEAKEAVQIVESKLATTQNHYGDYMALLSKFEGVTRQVFALAMVRNGGNRQGIVSALQILG